MVKNVILRADDLGFCEAVNLGIAKTIEDGPVRTVGLMVNMEAAEHGLKLIKGKDICLGLHSNISVGTPVCRPSDIPTLVDENGGFHSSARYRSGEDFASCEDLYKEITAQYRLYREMTGSKPSYFEAHAVMCRNLDKVLREIAREEGLLFQPPFMDMEVNGIQVRMCAMHSMDETYDARSAIRQELSRINDSHFHVYVCHPGYLDSYVWNHSSLRVPRMSETEMLCDPGLMEWMEASHVKIRTYDDLS